MLPPAIPTLHGDHASLRPFRDTDASLVQMVADDPLIPLITTVPTSGSLKDALAYIARQHDRLTAGAGYSFAITDSTTGEPVGQIGLWLRDIRDGRASTGYWVATPYRRRGFTSTRTKSVRASISNRHTRAAMSTRFSRPVCGWPKKFANSVANFFALPRGGPYSRDVRVRGHRR